ncbi:thrombopoietin isoform X1 [Betta splendens]|uniref:Thrombopoietin isoform X1 n=1 Tax=Betta splendens TaxID=158456 RepID=A0A6P7L0J2_BETSP|nr:thrombopoietin isoform X1 [Betta splendens]
MGHFPLGRSLNGPGVDSSGAAKQGMAVSRLLLLCMVATEVWDAETKPKDFVCNRAARRALNIVMEMEGALGDCSHLRTLSSPVQLPCPALHVASWENKSRQEKRGDIVASLKVLVESVKVLQSLNLPTCGSSLLRRLETNVNNYLLVVTRLRLSGPAVEPALSCVPRSTRSVSTLLLKYNQLLTGKVEMLMVDLEDTCTSQ